MDCGANSYNRFMEGDESGLSEIVEQYSDGLLLFINGFVNDYYAAEDLMEDTFAELLVRRHSFRRESLFKTYLYKIGRNKALNYLKKHSRLKIFCPEADKQTVDENSQIESELIHSERNRLLHQAIQKIKYDYRQILYLLYFEDMSYCEAGCVMKKSTKQIKNLAYRAKQALKRQLEKEEGFKYYEEL